MKRNLLSFVAGVAVLVFMIGTADARPRPGRGDKFVANKTFGIGLMLGAPTAVCGKYYLSADTALDFGVGAYYQYRDRDGLHLHADFLWHPVTIAKADPFWVPLYVGIGARFLDHRDRDSHVGVRVPFGIALDFQRVPIDIFFEVAVVFDFLLDDARGHGRGDFGGAIGLRYYF